MGRGDRERWDDRHRAEPGGDDPPEWLVLAADVLPVPGDALDLACGGGQALAWLAARGWRGTGVDVSPVALAAARARAPHVAWVEADLDDWAPDRAWELVACLRYWSRELVPKIRRAIVPGGLLVAEALTRARSVRFGVDPGELLRAFSDWDVLEYRERPGSATARLLARRPR